MKWSLAVIITLFFTLNSYALTFSESEHSKRQKSIYAKVGFTSSGFTIGADYEFNKHKTYSVGGYARFAPKGDDASELGGIALGGFIRPHFFLRTWDFYASAGMGIVMINNKTKDETVLGPSLAFGMLYQIKPQWSIGIEQMNHYSWFASTYKGKVIDSLLFNVHYGF